jgi:hypothetical protein
MTPDVNILLAASRTDHPLHTPALEWLQNAMEAAERGQALNILPMVASGFLRLATHPKVFTHPTPMASALSFLRAVLDAPGVEMPALGPEWPLLERLCTQHKLSGNDIPDAWIAASVMAMHGHLASFDKGFKKLLKASQFTLLKA